MRYGLIDTCRRVALLPGVLILVAFAGAGCAMLTVQESPEAPARAAIEWHDAYLREHLRFFNGTESEGRGTASRGYTRTAAYVGARMRQFGLQPGLQNDFRLIYPTPLNYPLAAELVALASDTLRFYPGVDFLPDARSDSGRVEYERVLFLPNDPSRWPRREATAPRVALLDARRIQNVPLDAVRDAGFSALLVVGPLRPHTAPQPVSGLVIQQVTPVAASLLLGTAPGDSVWTRAPGGTHTLPHQIRMRVVTDYQRDAGAINVLGFLAGKHPVRREELVLVCADLDAIGQVGGVRTLDPRDVGTHAAALLEVARNYSGLTRWMDVPERTILFAVFSGSRLGNAGLKAYLQNPLWEMRKTVSVVYIGLPGDREPDVRNLLAPFDIPLHAVPAATLQDEERVPFVLPEAADIRRAGPRATGLTASAGRTSALLEEAISRARLEAAATHRVLFPLTSGFSNRQLLSAPISEIPQ